MSKKAFTIIELVIVISVLIILLSIAIPRMKGMQQAGNITKVRGELQTFQAAIESYYNNSSPHAYPGAVTTSSTAIGETYLVSASPQIITSPLYDPFNPTASTEYNYYLSSNSQYYVIASMGPNGQWACFTAGTKILLTNGHTKSIETLQVGDILLSQHHTHNKLLHLRIMPKQDWKIFSFNEGRYFVTDNHLFMTTKGWEAINPKLAQKKYPKLKINLLQVGDELVTHDGLVKLRKINFRILKNSVVYDPQLDGNHLYYADGFLVHNLPPSSPTIGITGIVTKSGDDICVTNGTGC